jgi:restriction system protein
VGRPAIQGFVGALTGAGATRGVFITTSKFSADAKSYAKQVPLNVVLIDGEKLGQLLIQYRVGVQVKQEFAIVEIDEDFFEE